MTEEKKNTNNTNKASKVNKVATKKVPLNADQMKFAKLRADEAKVLDLTLKAQLKSSELELELGLPQRKASEAMDNLRENIRRNTMNAKYWDKQIREGMEVSASN